MNPILNAFFIAWTCIGCLLCAPVAAAPDFKFHSRPKLIVFICGLLGPFFGIVYQLFRSGQGAWLFLFWIPIFVFAGALVGVMTLKVSSILEELRGTALTEDQR